MRACRLPERPLQGACVPLMVARALRVHLTRREGAEGGTPLQARPTHSCSTACELRARRWLLAPEGGQAQRRVRPPTPRCAHGALRSTRAAGPPDVSPPRPPDERDNRSGRHTYGGTAPSRQAGVSSTACTSAIVHNQGITVVVRVVDCYARKLPALLHGDVLAWAATGRLAPTPQHRGHPRRRVKLL